MTFTTIELSRQGPIALLGLNRPDKLNAINAAMIDEINAALDQVEGDTAVIGISDFAQQQLSDLTYVELPGAGDEITAGFEFDVPVRFDTDRIRSSVASFQAGEVPDVPVIEVRA